MFRRLTICLVLSSQLLLSGCSENSDAKAVALNYQQVLPFELKRTDSYQIERRFAGTVTARQHADLGFELNGKLDSINVDEGDTVNQTSVLATLDTELLNIEKQQLNAQFKETAARLKLVLSGLARHHSLKGRGFSSEQRGDELQADQDALLANQSRVKASLAAVNSRIKKTILTAPFSGIVSRRYADAGTVVNAGSPVLRIQELGLQELYVGIPAALSTSMKLGEIYKVSINDTQHQARLLTVGSNLDAVTRTVQLRLALPDTALAPSGALAYLYLDEHVVADGYWVPAQAVTDGIRGMWAVYTVNKDPDSDDKALYRVEANTVNILHGTDTRYYISAEFEQQQKIVANGLHRIVPHQNVTLLDSEAN